MDSSCGRCHGRGRTLSLCALLLLPQDISATLQKGCTRPRPSGPMPWHAPVQAHRSWNAHFHFRDCPKGIEGSKSLHISKHHIVSFSGLKMIVRGLGQKGRRRIYDRYTGSAEGHVRISGKQPQESSGLSFTGPRNVFRQSRSATPITAA